jgi:hydrogenase maturation protein HypF
LDFRPLLRGVVEDRVRGRDIREIARSFQMSVAQGLAQASTISLARGLDTVVLSGGVFQNDLLLEDLKSLLPDRALQIWTNHAVRPTTGESAWARLRWQHSVNSI